MNQTSEIRCKQCNKLLFKDNGGILNLEIKCPRCRALQKVERQRAEINENESRQ